MSNNPPKIRLAHLRPDPEQPRTHFDEDELQALADSIRSDGVIQPITYFIDDDGKKTILDGERRWRASEIAGAKTIPGNEVPKPEPKQRLILQVSANMQREGLNPIEMARFFERLVTEHEIKPTDLPGELEKHGFRAYDRSYISNIRRLLKLPDEVQEMIATGELSAAQGKYLMPMLSSEKVTKAMIAFLKKQGPTLRTESIDNTIRNLYREHHLFVNGGRENPEYGKNGNYRVPSTFETAFDFKKACKDCKTCQRFNASWNGPHIYCLNESCYDEKQAAGLERKEKRETAAEKQRQKQQAATAKKNSGKSEAQIAQAAGRIERTQKYLDELLRPQIEAHLLTDDTTRYQLVLWMAAGAPGDYGCGSGQSWSANPGNATVDIREEGEFHDFESGINFTLNQRMEPKQLELMVVHEGINAMSRQNLRKLAHHCDIKLEEFYKLDREYLDIKTRDDILQVIPDHLPDTIGDWGQAQKKLSILKDRLLDRIDQFGIPKDLLEMYNDHDPKD